MLTYAYRYALPEGVFFNGSKYINWEGETLKEHPCMPEMISDYLKQEHLGIERERERESPSVTRTLKASSACIVGYGLIH
jgi:hypothetical protein